MTAASSKGWRRLCEELAIAPNPINKYNLVIHGFTLFAIFVILASLFTPGWTTALRLSCTVAGVCMWIASKKVSDDYGIAVLCMILAGVVYTFAQLISGDKSPYLGFVYLKGAFFSAAFPVKEEFIRIIAKRAEQNNQAVPDISDPSWVRSGEGRRLTIFLIAVFSLLFGLIYGQIEERKDRLRNEKWIGAPTAMRG